MSEPLTLNQRTAIVLLTDADLEFQRARVKREQAVDAALKTGLPLHRIAVEAGVHRNVLVRRKAKQS
ncbi:MAG TPA: hypothetical protein VKA83_05505 [Methylomirabilota bacterium]|nr:hypothetical protein [Methylomirabilota bacterium]